MLLEVASSSSRRAASLRGAQAPALAHALAMVAIALGILLAGAVRAEEAAGDWLGVMQAPTAGELTLAVHLRKTPTGYEGTLDTVEFGLRGTPVAGVAASADRLAFEVPSARARFEGAWDPAAGAWVGTWTTASGQQVPLRLARGQPPPLPRVEGLDGDWAGALNVGPAGLLRLVFHLRTDADGTTVTLDSIDQGASGAPATIRRDGQEVVIEMRALQARFVADLLEDGNTLQGEFAQGPAVMPLVIRRTGDAPASTAAAIAAAPPPARWSLPDEAAIRAVLARRIDEERRGVGVVVGVVSPQGRRIVAYGAPRVGDPGRVDGDTLFEIGSITKVFTALLLQDMALKGEVGLDDPVAKHLPAEVRVPAFQGRHITLRHLATHTSGLPRDFTYAAPLRTPEEIYAKASQAELYRLLSQYELTRAPGEEWAYSNVGMGLLGVALSRRAGVDLETLIRQRITGPLGMTTTTLDIGRAVQSGRLASGHDAWLRPVEPFVLGDGVAAAGALRSSADEMLGLLEAELGLAKTPLARPMAAMLAEERAGMRGFRQALGWMILDPPSGRIFTHSGGTLGHRAFAAFNPKSREGVVVLTNSEGAAGADDIGLFVISGVPVRPLPPAPAPREAREARAEVPLTAAAAQPYLGRYRLSRSIRMTVGYDEGRLTVQTAVGERSGPVATLASHGDGDFSIADGQADIAFQVDGGRASALVFRGPAGEFRAPREAATDAGS